MLCKVTHCAGRVSACKRVVARKTLILDGCYFVICRRTACSRLGLAQRCRYARHDSEYDTVTLEKVLDCKEIIFSAGIL